MFLVGLTGGIATGKSTVSKMFEDYGVPIIDSDLIAREVVRPELPAWKKIRLVFGDEVLMDNGELNREKLGQIIFTDPEKRKQLNGITHPEIYKVMLWRVFKYFLKGHQFVILDLPLLYESGKMVSYMSSVIVVACDESTQIDRLMLRNKLSRNDACNRIKSQMSVSEKIKLADYIIDNSCDLDSLKPKVETVFKKLRQSHAHWKLRLILLTFLGSFFIFGYLKFH